MSTPPWGFEPLFTFIPSINKFRNILFPRRPFDACLIAALAVPVSAQFPPLKKARNPLALGIAAF
jgi:hypothetical protein